MFEESNNLKEVQMNLYQQLQLFYSEVHKCFKGKGSQAMAWTLIENAIESSQDGGTFFRIEREPSCKVIVDHERLAKVLDYHHMGAVEIDRSINEVKVV